MKKLLFAIAGAAAFSAFATDVETPLKRTGDISIVGFENYTVDRTVIGYGDNGEEGNSLWTCAGDDASLVKTYGGDNAAAPSGITFPAPFEDGGTKYLALDTNGSELQRAIPAAGQAVAADGTYIDTLVQFTPSESAPSAEDLTNAKLAIWLGVDSTVTPNTTNLYVQGAYYDSTDGESLTVNQTKAYKLNKYCEPGTWYRLTVKAYQTIGNDAAISDSINLPAFSILIDGEEIATSDAVYSQAGLYYLCPGENPNDGDADKNYLASDVLTLFKAGKIIPSCDMSRVAATLTSVGFKGTGALDDFVVTTEAPAFGPAAIDFQLTWPAGLTAVSYQIGENAAVSLSGETSPFAVPGLAGGETVKLIVQNADGVQKTLTATAADEGSIDASATAFTWADYLGDAVDGAYEIDNLAELKLFQKGVANTNELTTANTTFKLTADIALDEAWPGIGIQNAKDLVSYKVSEIGQAEADRRDALFAAAAFMGTFDGQNHTVSGFQMVGIAGNPANNGEGLDYAGFFNCANGATIQNLKIQYAGGLFAVDTTASSKESGATFVGVAKNSTLQNLTTVAGSVSCSKGFGGIVGYLTTGSTVQFCTNNVNLTSLANNKAGGIAMIRQGSGSSTIANCQNNGAVASTSAQHGGIVGYVDGELAISNCENTVAYKVLHNNSGTITVTGENKGHATVKSYTNRSTPNLNFATVSGSVATFVADNALAAGETPYKVMSDFATATYEFTAAGSISFDTNMIQAVTFAITAAQGLDAPTEATENGVVTFTVASQGVDIEPGQQDATVYTTSEEATAALANVTIVEPEDVSTNATITAEDKAAYDKLFAAKVVEVSGGYAIEVGLTAAAETTLQEQANDDAAEIVDAIDDGEVTFDTTPGLYYSIEYGTSLSLGNETDKVMATGKSLTLGMPAKPVGATSGFYKVKISITK